MRKLAQRDDDGRCRQSVNLGAQVMVTLFDLVKLRLVLRGQTLDRIGNTAVEELQFIVTGNGLRLITEAVFK